MERVGIEMYVACPAHQIIGLRPSIDTSDYGISIGRLCGRESSVHQQRTLFDYKSQMEVIPF